MDKWLMVVVSWGIVGPILAIGACYVISWGMSNESWRPACRLTCSRHRLHLYHGRLLTKTNRRKRTSAAVNSFYPCRTGPTHFFCESRVAGRAHAAALPARSRWR